MLRRLLRRRERNPLSGTVLVDDEAVTFHRTYTTETVRWDDLQGVDIWTTDDPPGRDVYWALIGSAGAGAMIPLELVGDELLERLMNLPDFDPDAMVRAMGATGEHVFTCWRAGGSRLPRLDAPDDAP